MTRHRCPVCGLATLDAPPYELWPPPPAIALRPPYVDALGDPSYEVCPVCGYEFGFDDDPGAGMQGESFDEYHRQWVAAGHPLFDERGFGPDRLNIPWPAGPGVLAAVERWFAVTRVAGSGAPALGFARGPADRDKASVWVTFEGVTNLGQVTVWDTGECEVEAGRLEDGEILLQRSLELVDGREVGAVLDEVLALTTLPGPGLPSGR